VRAESTIGSDVIRGMVLLLGSSLLCTGAAGASDRRDSQIEMCQRILAEAGIEVATPPNERVPADVPSGYLLLGLSMGAARCLGKLVVQG